MVTAPMGFQVAITGDHQVSFLPLTHPTGVLTLTKAFISTGVAHAPPDGDGPSFNQHWSGFCPPDGDWPRGPPLEPWQD